jgi:hypothetical protein
MSSSTTSPRSPVRRFLALFFCCAIPLLAQSNTGELHVKIMDPGGLGLKSSVTLVCEATHFRESYDSDANGNVSAKHLPFGLYHLQIVSEGFAPKDDSIEIRSAIPTEYSAALTIASSSTSVIVHDQETLIDPYLPGAVNRIGADTLETRPTSLPGRSLVDLVNSQPGWLFEGSAVLHPRGSEYQIQFVVDGVPLTDNRSPGFGVEIEGDDVQSLTLYTAGFPAEYGRKLGGVVEVETARDDRKGFHGKFIASGGSFDTADGYFLGQYTWDKNILAVTADGSATDRYLNPPVVQNYTNTGSNSDYSIRYERDLTDNDRVGFFVRHGVSRFEIPDELVQQAAAQRQDRAIFETLGLAFYQHTFSSNILADFRAMARDDSQFLNSNPLATPIIAFQNRGFREFYVKSTVSIHHGRQEWKSGVEVDSTHIHESFIYNITNPSEFDPLTPLSFTFPEHQAWDLEQCAFVQDQIRLGKWTVTAGLRWDHYQLIVDKNALSPRLALSRFFPSVSLVLHASYDRVFQTPFFENILLSSSSLVTSLNPNFLRLPVQPSNGDYFELGATRSFFDSVKLDVNVFDRRVDNYLDDDQLLDTGTSFPITFANANLYGAEAKLELPHWRRSNAFISYSYIVGSVSYPVTGGLFLGQEATAALAATGRFWDSQDQRNSVRARARYDFTKRWWAAIGGDYGSGLPSQFDSSQPNAIANAIAEYGRQVVDRVNFARNRVKPNLSIDLSVGAELYKSDKLTAHLQADVSNLNNRLNLIDFAGLFSGNAIAPPRSYALRLTTSF